jgi:ABC-type multidrug transport system fused ATPase/permease subunit
VNREPGAPEETVHGETSSSASPGSADAHSAPIVTAVLPKYEIDASPDVGQKPVHIQGHLSFKNVEFSYPTRPNEMVLKGLSTDVRPGQTVAFVGPRYVTCFVPLVFRRTAGCVASLLTMLWSCHFLRQQW